MLTVTLPFTKYMLMLKYLHGIVKVEVGVVVGHNTNDGVVV